MIYMAYINNENKFTFISTFPKRICKTVIYESFLETSLQ